LAFWKAVWVPDLNPFVRFRTAVLPTKKEEQVMDDTSREEQLVEEYIQDGDLEAAVKLLYGLIVKLARQKQFSKAEALREKLLETDPMALSEIIKTAEIIEEEKIVSMDKTHKELWAKFYDTLTTEEASILYYAMKQSEYEPNQVVFEQGTLHSRLYFIDHGELKLVCRERNRETFLGKIGPGNILGEDLFFSNSVCTLSLISTSTAKVHYLEKSCLSDWEKQHPALVAKLHDLAKTANQAQRFIKNYQFDRRHQKRYRVSGKCQIQIVNSSGEPIGRPFYGELSDVSVGGLAFLARITKKETARMLLGRRLRIIFDLPVESLKEALELEATIVAVRDYAFEDCSIHLKFRHPLSEELLDRLEQSSTP
jgi:CRP-like cAMP-binding protein